VKNTVLEDKTYEKQCVWKTDGYQCQSMGHLSTTISGGPWYCRSHFARLMGWPSWEAAVVDDSQEAIDERVNKIVPRHTGESEHAWSMRCRQWTLDRLKRPLFQTEPGELG
jgi:hypothetical protein